MISNFLNVMDTAEQQYQNVNNEGCDDFQEPISSEYVLVYVNLL
jgi:hypothetical protein